MSLPLASTSVLTVSQLTSKIKNQLEMQFSSLLVQGEITNLKPNSSGHLYFDLKDEGAKLPAVMFKGKTGSLARMPKEGDQIMARGTLTVYPPHGRYQMIVEAMEFQGIGALLLKLEELKRKLKEKGYFEKERKKALPKYPKRIGVVTSPTGAVIRDIIHILTRRYRGFHLILNPVKVQGEGASFEIAQAIDQFNAHKMVDVIIVARGGGSLEDLFAFNEEIVATAIFKSQIPIISAVGHETDFTIADFVADLRAPTPSAAAEIVIAEKEAQLAFLQKCQKGLQATLFHLIRHYKATLQGYMRQPFLTNPYLMVSTYIQKIDEMRRNLDKEILLIVKAKKEPLLQKKRELLALNPRTKIPYLKNSLLSFRKQVDILQKNILEERKKTIASIISHFQALDPKNVLKRGYSILFSQKKASVIVSAQDVDPQDEVYALLAQGRLDLTVKEVKK